MKLQHCIGQQRTNNLKACELLVRLGANIDAKSIEGRTALIEAVSARNIEFANLLIFNKSGFSCIGPLRKGRPLTT